MKLKTLLFVTVLLLAKSAQLSYAAAVSPGDYIIGGSAIGASNTIARSTVALVMTTNSPETGIPLTALCTGSLLDQDMIVTAAHCLEGNPGSVRIVFSTELTADALKNPIYATRYFIHPDYRADAIGPDQNDIALVTFQGGLPSGYVPNHLLTDDRLLKRDESVILAGYGVNDPKTHAGSGVLRETHVQIADESFGRSEVLLAQTHGRGACHGDSGGPAFLVQNGILYLWGVTSRAYPETAPDDCAHQSVYTKIMEHMDFIRAAVSQLRR